MSACPVKREARLRSPQLTRCSPHVHFPDGETQTERDRAPPAQLGGVLSAAWASLPWWADRRYRFTRDRKQRCPVSHGTSAQAGFTGKFQVSAEWPYVPSETAPCHCLLSRSIQGTIRSTYFLGTQSAPIGLGGDRLTGRPLFSPSPLFALSGPTTRLLLACPLLSQRTGEGGQRSLLERDAHVLPALSASLCDLDIRGMIYLPSNPQFPVS